MGKPKKETTKLKPPLYALLIAPDHMMRLNILDGKKKITIRQGHRDYKEGRPVIICCHVEPWAVMAEITSVKHCKLKEVEESEYLADGFESQEDLLKGLQKYYPNITMDSPVTVIKWDNVQGYWIENREVYRGYAKKLETFLDD